MDKNILSLFVENVKEKKKIIVTKYEQQWSNPDKEYFIIIHYQIPIENRPYMTQSYITDFSTYSKWEKIYLRGLKIKKLIRNDH